jgi:hypothetical protein
MRKKVTANARPTTRKTWKRKTPNGEKEAESGLANSLYKWGEDYYGAEDYYEKTVNSMSKINRYNDYHKKTNK